MPDKSQKKKVYPSRKTRDPFIQDISKKLKQMKSLSGDVADEYKSKIKNLIKIYKDLNLKIKELSLIKDKCLETIKENDDKKLLLNKLKLEIENKERLINLPGSPIWKMVYRGREWHIFNEGKKVVKDKDFYEAIKKSNICEDI